MNFTELLHANADLVFNKDILSNVLPRGTSTVRLVGVEAITFDLVAPKSTLFSVVTLLNPVPVMFTAFPGICELGEMEAITGGSELRLLKYVI